jgi:superfamily II DNA helicase RecQ
MMMQEVFGTTTPHEWQKQVIAHLCLMHMPGGGTLPVPVLLAHPTGGGKSSARDVCSVMCAGFSLTIVPLLWLGADQEEKQTLEAKHTEGAIMSVHLDEICLAADQEQLIMKLKLLPNESSTTVVLKMTEDHAVVERKQVL